MFFAKKKMLGGIVVKISPRLSSYSASPASCWPVAPRRWPLAMIIMMRFKRPRVSTDQYTSEHRSTEQALSKAHGHCGYNVSIIILC
jgi:hypothetical protein